MAEKKGETEKAGPLAALKDIMSGTMGGVAQVCVGHPLDTVKVRLQSQMKGQPQVFNGMMDCFTKTLKNEGFAGLYKGAASPLTGAMAHNAALFFSYEQSKRFLGAADRQLTLEECFLAGGFTGAFVSFVETPIDLLKSKLQAQLKESTQPNSTTAATPTAPSPSSQPAPVRYTGVFDAAGKITRTYGIRGLFQGFTATVCRNFPAFGAYFCGFEYVKRTLTPEGEVPPLYVCFLAGGFAGFAFWGPNYPLDMVKTRVQTDATDRAHRRYKNTLDCWRKVLRDEGLGGFYKGYVPCLVRAVPVNASIFFAVEATKRLIAKPSPNSSGH